MRARFFAGPSTIYSFDQIYDLFEFFKPPPYCRLIVGVVRFASGRERIVMKSNTRLLWYLCVILPAFIMCRVHARSTVLMQEHYKKVADGLIGVHKEHPASQQKVYALLDQLDKFYATAKQVSQKKQLHKKKMNESIAENVALKTEIKGLRSNVSVIKKSVEFAKNEFAQKLAEEKVHTAQLELERKDLLDKLASIEVAKKDDEQKIDLKEQA